ncbi:hypothetical protein HK102_014033, partial [Quaeritorhiza haematococci]
SMEDDLVELLRQCGQTFKYLNLTIYADEYAGTKWRFLREDLLRTIADCCPNLRGLRLDIPKQNRSSCGSSRLDAVGQLLDKCGHLRTLDIFDPEELKSDPELKAKMRCIFTKFWSPKYCDWRMRAVTLLFLVSVVISTISLWSATGVNAAGRKGYYDYKYDQKNYYGSKAKSYKDYGYGDKH